MKDRIFTEAELKHLGASQSGNYMVLQKEGFIEFYEQQGRGLFVFSDKYPATLPRQVKPDGIKRGGLEGEMLYWR